MSTDRVEKDGTLYYGLEQKNKFSVGDEVEVMKADGRNINAVVRKMLDEDLNEIESCPHPKQHFYVDLGVDVDEYDIIRKSV